MSTTAVFLNAIPPTFNQSAAANKRNVPASPSYLRFPQKQGFHPRLTLSSAGRPRQSLPFATVHHVMSRTTSNYNYPRNSPLHGIIGNIFKGCTALFAGVLFSGALFLGKLSNPFRSHNIFCPPPAIATQLHQDSDNKENSESHGLPANIIVQLHKLNGFKKYRVSGINFLNPRTRSVAKDAKESFGDLVQLRPGGLYTKHDLMEQLKYLTSSDSFEKIDLDLKTNPDGSVDVNLPFQEKIYPMKTRVRYVSYGTILDQRPIEMDPDLTAKEQEDMLRMIYKQMQERIDNSREPLLPEKVEKEVREMLRGHSIITEGLLRRMGKRIDKWYHENGYLGAQVMRCYPLNDEFFFEVCEGDVGKLVFTFHDKLGNVCEGNTNLTLIDRVLPDQVQVGKAYNERAFGEALRNIKALKLFQEGSPQLQLAQDPKTLAITAQIIMHEQDHKWLDMTTNWNLVPGPNRLPILESIASPSSTISFGYRNIKGLNRSLTGEITNNLFNPEDDVGYKFEYVHPYIDGVADPRNRTFRAVCFNDTKLSPIFRSGSNVDDDIPVWVRRDGIKATITEDYTRQSKFSYGLVLENIRTCDEVGNVIGTAHTVNANGNINRHGIPTTLSGNGVDRMAFLQANFTRDNTKFINGGQVGARDIFQIDQGVGIGTKFPIFNRHSLSLTRFMALKKVEEGKGKAPPPVLVLHGVYGGCVGDLPNYEAFPIGGNYSVRGYDMGEIGASRNKLELAAEVRIPVRIPRLPENTYVYTFAEHGNDLGSSADVKGNPTRVYMRKGSGSSYGAGIKLAGLRIEYVVDHNTGNGRFCFGAGDRF